MIWGNPFSGKEEEPPVDQEEESIAPVDPDDTQQVPEENEESESDQGVADLLGILDSKIEGKE